MAKVFQNFNSLLKWIDQYQRDHKFAGFLYAVIKKYGEDEAGHKAALLAYYSFLSLFPLLLILTTTLKLLLRSDSHLRNQIIHATITYFPIIGHDLQQNIHGMGKTGLALVIGIILTLFGARGVADILRNSLDHVWLVPMARRSKFPQAVFKSMSIITVGGIGFILAPVISGYALAVGHDTFFRLLSMALTLLILFSVMIFVIKVGGSKPRRFRQIWVGAAVAAVSLDILQSLGSLIVTRELRNLDNLYGTFAIVLGLLFWLYLQTQVLLYALEIDTVRILKLWPRSMQSPLTEADHRAFKFYARRANFYEQESPKLKT